MKTFAKNYHLVSTFFVVVALALFVLAFSTDRLSSAMPPVGTLNPTGPTIVWTGFPAAPIVGAAAPDENACIEGTNCDKFTVTLSGAPANWAGIKARIKISWAGASDFDVFIHKGTATLPTGVPSGPIVGSAATSGPSPEVVELDPSIASIGTGDFIVSIVYFLVDPGVTYNGEASAVTGVAPTPTPSPGSTPTPTPLPPGSPRFHNFTAPPGTGEDAGEPSIGSNWLTENVVRAPGQTFANSNGVIPNGGTTTYYGGFLAEMLRITFDDCSSPAAALWEKKPLVLASTPRALGDPILFTDHGYPALIGPGRTFVSQEEAQAGSTTDVTDDDGDSFTPSVGAGAPAGVDHQTVAAGPYSTAGVIPPSALPYPATGPRRAVYYASQSVSDARTSRSDDGGITFGPAIPMYTTADCGGLHGHLKVAPDGTVYVPNNACGGTTDPIGHADGEQAVIVSVDNGVTWSIRQIPTTDTKSDRDPSVGIATDGTIYVGQQSKDGHARISVSHDRGLNWDQFPGQAQLRAYDVGAQLGIQNMAFAEVVAGDPDRAAFAFFGTTTADDPTRPAGSQFYDDPAFPGVWYLYIATTFDGGATWVTQNVTPGDPIQRGGICGGGDCRNLLDFFDATLDRRGRVLIGGEDGCIGGCVNGGNNSFTAKAFISRQAGGKRMFAAFDPVEPAVPAAPGVTATVTGSVARLIWSVPDNGGSEIISYRVHKSSGGGAFALLATVTVPNYTDSNFTSGDKYRVTAVNGINEGPYCNDIIPTSGPVETACVLPGILTINDLNPDGTDNDSAQNTPVDPRVNIRQLFLGEPFVSAGIEELFFTMNVAPSTAGSAPPNSQWFIIWDRQGTHPISTDPDRVYVAMTTDAAGTPSYEYGDFGHPINTGGTPPPPPDGTENVPVRRGAADSGSYDPLSGVIRIVVSDSKFRAIDGGANAYTAGTSLGGINVRTYFNRPDAGQRSQNNASDITDNSNYSLVGNTACAPAAQLVSAVSRKVHGTAGTFDIRLLPAGPDGGIECRSGGANSNYQVVMTFASPVSFASATASGGNVASTSTDGNSVTVNLTGVPNAQITSVTLNGATTGGAPTDIPVPLALLVGDGNANRATNSSDVGEAKTLSGSTTDGESFRFDVNTNGTINSSDISVIKANSGNSLPSAAPQQKGARTSDPKSAR